MRLKLSILLTFLSLLAAGCTKSGPVDPAAPFRLGYFPNITHAQALVGDADGTFARALQPARLETKQFNAGPSAMEALVAGSLDASYVGPSPAINTFLKAGRELRIIAGSANGGAVLVTRTAKSAQELKGKRVASPQLGNTQDVALRQWLRSQGLTPSDTGGKGGDVTVQPLANPDILAQFQRGELEGAWVPEPWGARLVAEGGGRILLDERELWPEGRFPTTVLVTTRKILETRREALKALLRAHLNLTNQWKEAPDAFAQATNEAFQKLAGKALPGPVLKDAFSRLEPTAEPPTAALARSAEHARELGFIASSDVAGLVDTSLLQEVLAGQAQSPAR